MFCWSVWSSTVPFTAHEHWAAKEMEIECDLKVWCFFDSFSTSYRRCFFQLNTTLKKFFCFDCAVSRGQGCDDRLSRISAVITDISKTLTWFSAVTYLGLKLGKVWAKIDFPALDTIQSFFDFYWPSLLDSVATHSTNNDSMDTFLCAFFRIFIFVQNNIIFIRKVCKRARFEQKENDYLQDSCNWWNCISLEKSLVNSYNLCNWWTLSLLCATDELHLIIDTSNSSIQV